MTGADRQRLFDFTCLRMSIRRGAGVSVFLTNRLNIFSVPRGTQVWVSNWLSKYAGSVWCPFLSDLFTSVENSKVNPSSDLWRSGVFLLRACAIRLSKKQLCHDFIVFFDNNTSRILSFFLLSSLDVNQYSSRSKTVGNLGLMNKFSFDCSLDRTNNSGTVAPKLNQWTLLADWAKWWVSRICGWAISILTRWAEWINRSCNTPPSAYFWTMHNH